MKKSPNVLHSLSIVALLSLFLGGCATSGTGAGEDPSGEQEEPATFTLQIDNDNHNDARIQVFFNGATQNLGRVRGSTTGTFRVRRDGTQMIIRVEFAQGGRRYDSQPITVLENQVVRYRIDP